jgi:hypothetical protein
MHRAIIRRNRNARSASGDSPWRHTAASQLQRDATPEGEISKAASVFEPDYSSNAPFKLGNYPLLRRQLRAALARERAL